MKGGERNRLGRRRGGPESRKGWKPPVPPEVCRPYANGDLDRRRYKLGRDLQVVEAPADTRGTARRTCMQILSGDLESDECISNLLIYGLV